MVLETIAGMTTLIHWCYVLRDGWSGERSEQA